MNDTSRRKFLAASGAGAAGVVAATGGTAHAVHRRPDAAREEVVAHVADHRLDQVRLLVGEREIIVHDRELVTRILNAAGRK